MPENSRPSIFEKFAPVLVLVTVALAFVVGILWQKVTTLEKGGVKLSDTSVGTKTQGKGAPEVNGKLSDEQAGKVAAVSDEDHIRGGKDAEIFLIEYSDLECPFCKQFHKSAQQAVGSYEGKVAWVYRHFPLDTLHSKADKEAEGAECAFDQKGNDGFWAYVDRVFEITPSNNGLDEEELPKIASYVGLDVSEFNSCLNSRQFKDKVESQYQSGISAGVTGTPGNFVMNKKGEVWVIPGYVSFESLKLTIDEALKS